MWLYCGFANNCCQKAKLAVARHPLRSQTARQAGLRTCFLVSCEPRCGCVITTMLWPVTSSSALHNIISVSARWNILEILSLYYSSFYTHFPSTQPDIFVIFGNWKLEFKISFMVFEYCLAAKMSLCWQVSEAEEHKIPELTLSIQNLRHTVFPSHVMQILTKRTSNAGNVFSSYSVNTSVWSVRTRSVTAFTRTRVRSFRLTYLCTALHLSRIAECCRSRRRVRRR